MLLGFLFTNEVTFVILKMKIMPKHLWHNKYREDV